MLFDNHLKFINKLLNQNNKMNYYIAKFRNIKPWALALCFGNPFLPAFIFNVTAGIIKIEFKKYLTSMIIGKIVIILFWGYIGTSIIDSLTNVWILTWLVIVFITVYYISRVVSKRLSID